MELVLPGDSLLQWSLEQAGRAMREEANRQQRQKATPDQAKPEDATPLIKQEAAHNKLDLTDLPNQVRSELHEVKSRWNCDIQKLVEELKRDQSI